MNRLRREDVQRLRRIDVGGPSARMFVHACGEYVHAFGERALPAASVLVPWRSQLPAESGSPAKPVHPFRRRRPPLFGRSPCTFTFTPLAKPVHDLDLQATNTVGLACSGEFQGTSVLAAVEAKPAAPVLASLAASTASARTADELVMARKPERPNHQEFSPWRFKSKSSASN